MMYGYLIKGRKNAGKQSLFVWFESKSDSRADREVMNILEDAEIETGRGADYQLPVRTDMPVFDDLPEEGVLDATWCDRYELGEDSRTWQKVVAVTTAAPEAATETTVKADVIPENTVAVETLPEPAVTVDVAPVDKDLEVDANDDDNTEYPVAEMNFSRRLLAQFTSDATRHHIKHAQRVEIIKLSMDTDNSYVQNLLLAASNAPELQSISTAQLWKYTDAIKTVFPMDKHHELNHFLQFTNLWVSTEHIDRGILVREWANGNRITSVQRTPSGANAGGVTHSDRLAPQTILGMESEIALGIIARKREFDIYNVPLEVDILANSMMNRMDDKEFLATRELFVSMPGGLDYSRACNIATVKTTPENLWKTPARHLEYLNKVMTETDHAHPDQLVVDIACGRSSLQMPIAVETEQPSVDDVNKQLAAARGEYVEGISDPNDPKWVHENPSQTKSEQPVIANIGGGVFSIDGLMNEKQPKTDDRSPVAENEGSTNEQMEATDSNQIAGDAEIPAGEGSDATGAEAIAVEQSAITEEDAERTPQHIQLLEQRIERLESALAALGSIFNAPEEVAL